MSGTAVDEAVEAGLVADAFLPAGIAGFDALTWCFGVTPPEPCAASVELARNAAPTAVALNTRICVLSPESE